MIVLRAHNHSTRCGQASLRTQYVVASRGAQKVGGQTVQESQGINEIPIRFLCAPSDCA